MPAVSVVVPCFNAAQFLPSSLGSLENQTFQDWECLLVDDCSTDETAKVLKDFASKDSRFKPIFLSQNGGASAARNAGLDQARGELVTLLDADDAYAPDRLARLIELQRTTGADLVFDNQAIADFPDTTQVDTAFHWLQQDVQPFSAEMFFTESAIFGRSINPGYMKPMFRAEFLHSHNMRYDLSFRSGQDYLFYADAFATNPICFATKYCGYIYRRRVGSLSRSGGMHLRNHAKLSDGIIKRHGAELSSASIQALKTRERYFLQGAELHDFRVMLAEHHFFAALGYLLGHPGVLHAGLSAVRRKFLLSR